MVDPATYDEASRLAETLLREEDGGDADGSGAAQHSDSSEMPDEDEDHGQAEEDESDPDAAGDGCGQALDREESAQAETVRESLEGIKMIGQQYASRRSCGMMFSNPQCSAIRRETLLRVGKWGHVHVSGWFRSYMCETVILLVSCSPLACFRVCGPPCNDRTSSRYCAVFPVRRRSTCRSAAGRARGAIY